MLAVVHYLVLECLDASNADTVDHAHAVFVDSLQIHARVLDSLNGTDHGQLRAAVHLTSLLAVDVVIDIEVLDFTSELRLEIGCVK